MHHQTAQGIAALGRGEDKMLVHMTPGEVEGLQKLALAHGGSLTINPQTGLPEAGFLSSILPMAAAMAANMVVPGSGVIVGAGLGAMMNEKSPLMGAITGGLGGYGAGQLGTAFMGAGETALGNQAMATETALQGIPTTEALTVARQDALSKATPWDKLYAGATNNPMETIKGVGYGPLLGLAAPLVSGMMNQKGLENVPKTPTQYYHTTYSPGTYNPRFGQPGQPYFTGQGYGPGSYYTNPTQYAAAGGLMKDEPTGVESLFAKASPATLDRYKKGARNAALQAAAIKEMNARANKYDPNVGTGVTYAAGGMLLQGDGDGMSDSIPAVIQGPKPQRAALADGEFVIPADVVSHLGNGSTKSGAKRLYSMMDKVRQARTGTKKQGRQINPEQFMPA